MSNDTIQGIVVIISMGIFMVWVINSFRFPEEEKVKRDMHYFYALNISFLIMQSLCIWVLIYLKSP